MGGTIGDGAYVDRAFNTTDVCLILDTAQMTARAAALYGSGQ
jgi:putative hemolysin